MNVLSDLTYHNLLQQVKVELSRGLERARRAVEQERVQTYWNVGAFLVSFMESSDRSYGDNLLKKLAIDAGLTKALLYDTIRFRRTIETVAPGGLLTWSHYRRIIHLPEGTRARYLEAAENNAWSVRQLEAQIADGALDDAHPESSAPPEIGAEETRLVAKRGEPWVYRLVDKQGVGRALDLGFRVYKRLSSHDDPGLEVGSLVQSQKAEDGRYRIVRYDKRRRVYCYRATVASIIDADTLWVTIDCGFGTVCDQKVRLRSIDSPELKTPAGVRARDFVVKILSQVDQIIVSTTKLDLYDRYLSDILYLQGEVDPVRIAHEGHYLNREIVDAGHARRWRE